MTTREHNTQNFDLAGLVAVINEDIVAVNIDQEAFQGYVEANPGYEHTIIGASTISDIAGRRRILRNVTSFLMTESAFRNSEFEVDDLS